MLLSAVACRLGDDPVTDAATPRPLPAKIDLAGPRWYVNRELSLLEFQRRVLAQALDPAMPLLDRLRFLTISCNNLDEFFEIREAGVREQLMQGVAKLGAAQIAPSDLLRRIGSVAQYLVAEQYRALNEVLLPELEKEGIRLLKPLTWSKVQRDWAHGYFQKEVLPVLTPVGLDPAHPFPRVLNKSLNLILALEGKDAFGRSARLAVVQAPRSLPRVIRMPTGVAEKPWDFVLLSTLIQEHVALLFPGMKVKSCHEFRVTRDSDLWVDEEEVDDLMAALKGELTRRNFGIAVRLEVTADCPQSTIDFLLEQFRLPIESVYRVNGPVNLHRVGALCDEVDLPALKFAPFAPAVAPRVQRAADLFEAIREGDLLLHTPYESFAPVVDFAMQAAADPDVLAIKQTLYRTGQDSPLVEALSRAARSGKEVTVVIELRARFDEAANIDLATRLQEAGARVVYGIVGFKTHAKALLVVRREGAQLRRYVHLGTGNYHTKTARTYTDWNLLTAHPELTEDVHHLFQQLTGLGKVAKLKQLVLAPFGLQEKLLALIARETEEARAGRPAAIQAKMNGLTDPSIMQALYKASQAGVPIDLIVRGMCSLRPGIANVSQNIRVRSIVGRFLEHSRVFFFHAAGEEQLFLSSADWMERNLQKRVESCFPVLDKTLKQRVLRDGLRAYLEDNVQAFELQPDGSYTRANPGRAKGKPAQQLLLEKASG
ncbi:MAG: polyphosphate kinase 1 [Planctomycetes bacterium]|nr:polyphosphate kinase 1 [Planctomycetota bacterium]